MPHSIFGFGERVLVKVLSLLWFYPSQLITHINGSHVAAYLNSGVILGGDRVALGIVSFFLHILGGSRSPPDSLWRQLGVKRVNQAWPWLDFQSWRSVRQRRRRSWTSWRKSDSTCPSPPTAGRNTRGATHHSNLHTPFLPASVKPHGFCGR